MTDINLSESAKKLNLTEEEVQKAIEFYRKQKEARRKYTRSYKDLSPEQKEARNRYAARRRVRDVLLVRKALAAGITVTDQEIDEYLEDK
jgi:FKBP-type peptidyl-prolyl cis-trans isomerase (trigger factor)